MIFLYTIVKNSATLFPDFNNDGKTDLSWHNSTTGENAAWLMNASSISSGGFLPSLAGSNWGLTLSVGSNAIL
jgi:hypothetical protein